MNLCTDQLTMLVAAEGQIISVSHLATDPASSAMVAEAAGYVANHGRAEEIFLMEPDLVLTSPFSNPVAADMLRRLGVDVLVIDPVNALEDIPDRLIQIGAALGREEAAQERAEAFIADLDALRAEVADRPRAALYFAQGYAAGDRTLSGQILAAAGYDNIATEAGLSFGGTLPLELLVLADPDLVVTGQRELGASRAEDILMHPALAAFGPAATTSADWVCGTPHVLRAIEDLREARP